MTRKAHGGSFLSAIKNENILLHAKDWCNKQKKGFTATEFLTGFLNIHPLTCHLRSVETAQVFLNRMGFHYGSGKTGVYIDGHERKDVVQARIVFYNKMIELMQRRNDIIFIAQDESIYYAKDGLTQIWHNDASLKKKGKDKGIMVSKWFDEKELLEWISKKSLYFLKFGREWGYYTFEKFE